ncbi:conserved hypothetical protein [Methanococcus vannielii SB]|uniref:Class III signal peptide-containing protein n=1 Tax=Methanococcus vannielii (strain ATCC 35089 / DSM 1224 / JCM 13029 / OCM 148 / SB) TaxID=406327 RepID=A6USV2_METVS|nr:class III signal peptide-containing protein [Methanococcus vannielii]ABR55574.1 conserved hypothetical protein [Methanococcus vannielii SB]
MFKKISSKTGQVSMEIGILVAGAVVVSVVASYFYVLNSKYSDTGAGKTANQTSNSLLNLSSETCEKISKINVS